MAALQFVRTPGYSALLLRRSFADLEKPDSLIPRSHQMLAATDAQYQAARKAWRFPSGATLSFGYLDTDSDVYQYQSAAFQFCGFDELTQFSEFQYRYLFSRLRVHAGVNVPLRMRAATNPGGIGHAWVKERFGLGANSSCPPERVFIPSNLTDNPHLDEARYRKSLAELDHVTRRQLEFGDWDAMAEGLIFKREWFKIVDAVPSDLRKVRYWDLAATPKKRRGHDPDYTSGTLLGRSKQGLYYVLDVKRTRSSPLDVERLLLATATEDGRDVPVWMEQEPGSSGVHVVDHIRRNVLDGFELRAKRPDANKVARAKPFSAAAEAGNVFVLRGPWNLEWLREVESFPLGDHDDSVDSTTGAHQALSVSRVPAMSLI
jgi:predicted phage terminase large subunit-like protein